MTALLWLSLSLSLKDQLDQKNIMIELIWKNTANISEHTKTHKIV